MLAVWRERSTQDMRLTATPEIECLELGYLKLKEIEVECPKCKHVRTEADIGPSYECPKCGIIYAKFDPLAAERAQTNRAKVAARSAPQTSQSLAQQNQQAAVKAAPSLSDSSVINGQKNGAGDHGDAGADLLRDEDKYIPGNTAVCRHCEEVGQVTTKLPGNGWVEFVLYLLWIAPRIVYSVWRRKGVKQICAACGSEHLIAAKTRLGRQIVAVQFPSLTIGNDASSGVTKPPTFGKLTAVLLGFVASAFLLQAVGAAFIPDRGSALFIAAFGLIVAVPFALAARTAWKKKPIVVKIGQGLVGL